MNPTLELILTILLVVIGVVMTVMILMQNSKSEGLSASLSGAAETFFGKNKNLLQHIEMMVFLCIWPSCFS